MSARSGILTAPPAPRPRRSSRGVRGVSASSSAGDASSSSSSSSSLSPDLLLSSKLIFATSAALDHARDGHPESNARVPAILDALADADLTPAARPGELVELSGFRPASAEEVMRVHAKNFVSGLNLLCKTRAPMDLDVSATYITSASYDAALAGAEPSAGGAASGGAARYPPDRAPHRR